MAGVHCFTSISFSYLAKARVLAMSLKRFHPDWTLWVCITDKEPPGYRFDLAAEPFDRVVWADQLPIDNVAGWLFGHDVVEACTAVKGPVLSMLVETGEADKIFYLDPDIAVFGPLDSLVADLDTHDIVLTPHQTTPEEDAGAVADNEIASLQHGVFNLGFLGVTPTGEGRRFARWWDARLRQYCHDDIPSGLFVDQRWCDLAPAYFDRVKICRDPGCNVASWNLSRRNIAVTDAGDVLVDGRPLQFYHFTKIESVGLGMVNKYARDNAHVYELVSWYKHWLHRLTEPRIPKGWWHYGRYSNGEPIRREHRLLYRGRPDLQRRFPDPFADRPDGYYRWLRDHDSLNVGMSTGQPAPAPDGGPIADPSPRPRWDDLSRQIVSDVTAAGVGEVIVYGAGDFGRTLLPAAKAAGVGVRGIVDRNPLLWGQVIDGVPVMSLKDAMALDLPVYAVASSAFALEIARLIEDSYRPLGLEPRVFARRG